MTETANPCAAAARTRPVWHAPALWRSVARAAVQPDLLWNSSTTPVKEEGGKGGAAPEEGLCGEMEEGERQGEIDMESGIGAP